MVWYVWFFSMGFMVRFGRWQDKVKDNVFVSVANELRSYVGQGHSVSISVELIFYVLLV